MCQNVLNISVFFSVNLNQIYLSFIYIYTENIGFAVQKYCWCIAFK